MQVTLEPKLESSSYAHQAKNIIRSCVHCGFCNATCPTYQILSDELDGPRGRIYLIKDFLEGKELSNISQTHLDRCLQCQSCETTCPSGVQYGRLIDIGKYLLAKRQKRRLIDRVKRSLLLQILPYPKRFSILFRLLSFFPGILVKQNKYKSKSVIHSVDIQNKVQLLPGCVQSSLRPSINRACMAVLSKLNMLAEETPNIKCCGSVQYHMGDFESAKQNIRHNIDKWCDLLDAGNRYIVSTASGCSKFIKEYAFILQDDKDYAAKAKRLVEHFRDISELITEQDLSQHLSNSRKTIAFHSPCTLQHGLKQAGTVEKLLRGCGVSVLSVQDSHICCGSAGTYSIMQKELSNILLKNKIKALEKNKPDLILSANMACLLHLNKQAKIPIYHWIEYLDQEISSK